MNRKYTVPFYIRQHLDIAATFIHVRHFHLCLRFGFQWTKSDRFT
eukprot:UN14321